MHSAHTEMNLAPEVERESSLRDLSVVAFVTIISAALSAHFELSEAIVAWTRPWEHLQLDEIPAVLLALTAALAWFARRRYHEARVELRRRRAAEAQLASLLLEHRRLGQQLLQVQESERKTLAQELHDELGQYLNAIKIEAVTLESKTLDDSAAIRETAGSIIRHTDHVYAVVRDMIRKLRPVGLDDLGLKAALEHHGNDWRQRLPNVQIDISLAGDLDGIGEPLSLAVYRLAQEGMTNIARHAHARHVRIQVSRSSDEVTFHMLDDGSGADLHESRSGLGLIGMRERVAMLGGHLEITTQPARGFSILARIPVVQRVVETTR